jgi:hypothetical protein
MYKKIRDDLVVNLADNFAFSPLDTNRYAIAYNEWLQQGNIPEQVISDPSLIVAQIKLELSDSIQRLLDTTAQDLRYDNMMSVRSYAGYPNAFQEEAIKLAVWSADCWVKAGEIENNVLLGLRPIPTSQEVISEMPLLIY